MPDEDDKLRADARANRARILEVARATLAADPDAPLHFIAKTAGVGQGTLYRHFATREALVLSVYRSEIDALVELAPVLLAEHPPLQAFRMWCDRFAQAGRRKHGIAALVRAAMSDQDFQDPYWPMVGAVRQLLEACERSGEIAPDADAEDLLQLLGCMIQIPPTPEGEARTKRLRALVFRGLGAEDTHDTKSSAVRPPREPSRRKRASVA
jgi:AcrR family transcriptional regulator